MQRYRRTIESTYDEKARASYLDFRPLGPGGIAAFRTSGELVMRIHFDLGHDGRLCGMELLLPIQDFPRWDWRDTTEAIDRPEPRWSVLRQLRDRLLGPPRPRSRAIPIQRVIDISYDEEADSAYLNFAPAPLPAVDHSLAVDQEPGQAPIRVDFAGPELVGIEVGEASRALARGLLPADTGPAGVE